MKEKLWAGSIVFFAAFLAGTVAMTGCSPTPPGPQPPPDAVTVGSTSGAGPASCRDVCARGAALGCKWATPTPNGKPCEAVCAQAQTISPWNLSCRATAADCAAGDACEK